MKQQALSVSQISYRSPPPRFFPTHLLALKAFGGNRRGFRGAILTLRVYVAANNPPKKTIPIEEVAQWTPLRPK